MGYIMPASMTPLPQPRFTHPFTRRTQFDWIDCFGPSLGTLAGPSSSGRYFASLKGSSTVYSACWSFKNRMYTYRWVSLFIWLYFTEGVVRAWGDAAPSCYFAFAEVVLCVVLFIACALHVRLRFQSLQNV